MGFLFFRRETIFGLVPSEYEVLSQAIRDFSPYFRLWTMSSEFELARAKWLTGPFSALDAATVITTMETWWKDCLQLQKKFKVGSDATHCFYQVLTLPFVRRFQDVPAPLAVATQLRQKLTAFREIVPVIDALASSALRDWHWADISDVLGVAVHPADNLTLQALIDLVRVASFRLPACEPSAYRCAPPVSRTSLASWSPLKKSA